MMDEELSFSELLKSLRKKKRLKITDMVSLLGVSERTYKGWEMGERLPPQTYVKLIAKTLQLNETDEDTFYRAAGYVPQDTKHLPPHNDFFTGREAQLHQIGELLKENTTVAITQPVSISGLGGIGKTQLALEYAYRRYIDKTYRAVLWVDADEAMIESSYRSLADRLALPERKDQDIKIIVEAVKEWLEEHTSWLLIMDNADDLYLARSCFPAGHHGHILLTTRSQINSTIVMVDKQIELDEMTPEEGLHFLLKRSKVFQNDSNTQEAAQRLVELLGRHPLALDQAGAYIEETGVSIADYISRYQEKRSKMLSKRGASDSPYGDHPKAVTATIELSLQQARQRHPLAADILYFCSFLHPDVIAEEILQEEAGLGADISALHEGIAALRRYSLITYDAEIHNFSMHRLVQSVVADTLSPEARQQWRTRAVGTVRTIFPAIVPDWELYAFLVPHVLIFAQWKEQDIPLPIDVAELFFQTSCFFLGQGDYTRAEILLVHSHSVFMEHAQEFERAELAVVVFPVLNNLALVQTYLGRYEQAEQLHWQALEMSEKYLSREHPDFARSLYNIARLYRKWQSDDRKEEYESIGLFLRKALFIQGSKLGMGHPETFMTLYELASFYLEQDDYELAEVAYEEVIKIWDNDPSEQLKARFPDIEHAVQILKMAREGNALPEQTQEIFKRLVSNKEQRLGPNHPEVKNAREEYRNFLESIGKHAESAALEAGGGPPVSENVLERDRNDTSQQKD